MKDIEEVKFEQYERPKKIVSDRDLRIVQLPVKVLFEWSDEIVDDYDQETKTFEYKSGYIMRVVPNQSFVYKDEESIFIGSVFK